MDEETVKRLQTYIAAFEQGDFSVMEKVLEVAQTNLSLEKLIVHYHLEFEEDIPLRPEQWARIVALLNTPHDEKGG